MDSDTEIQTNEEQVTTLYRIDRHRWIRLGEDLIFEDDIILPSFSEWKRNSTIRVRDGEEVSYYNHKRDTHTLVIRESMVGGKMITRVRLQRKRDRGVFFVQPKATSDLPKLTKSMLGTAGLVAAKTAQELIGLLGAGGNKGDGPGDEKRGGIIAWYGTSGLSFKEKYPMLGAYFYYWQEAVDAVRKNPSLLAFTQVDKVWTRTMSRWKYVLMTRPPCLTESQGPVAAECYTDVNTALLSLGFVHRDSDWRCVTSFSRLMNLAMSSTIEDGVMWIGQGCEEAVEITKAQRDFCIANRLSNGMLKSLAILSTMAGSTRVFRIDEATPPAASIAMLYQDTKTWDDDNGDFIDLVIPVNSMMYDLFRCLNLEGQPNHELPSVPKRVIKGCVDLVYSLSAMKNWDTPIPPNDSRPPAGSLMPE